MMRPNPNFGGRMSVKQKTYTKHNWLTVVRSAECDNLAA
jgi:hypothetical protein